MSTNKVDEFEIKKKAAHDWQNKPEIREEFGSLDVYVAYAVAEANGQIKRLGRKQ